MKGGITVALLMTIAVCASVLIFSTTASAFHMPELVLTVEDTRLPRIRAGGSDNFELVVKNRGPDNIDRVRITAPTGWADFPDPVENYPPGGWKSRRVDARTIEFWTEENTIATEKSALFKFVPAPAPALVGAEAGYSWSIETRDVKGVSVSLPATITVDGKLPEITVSVTPRRVKFGVRVTVTITSNEPLKGIENVFLEEKENMVPTENRVIPVSPVAGTENRIWSGTIIPTIKENRQGYHNVRVVKARDLVLNENSAFLENAFLLDNLPPVMPEPIELPPPIENRPVYTLTGTARDTTWGVTDNAPVVAPWDNVLVQLLRDGVLLSENRSGADGSFTLEVKGLIPGLNTLRLRLTDEAGNPWENVAFATVFFDNTPPTITPEPIPVDRKGRRPHEDPLLAAQFKERVTKIRIKVVDPAPGFGFDNTRPYSIRIFDSLVGGAVVPGFDNEDFKWDNVNKWFWAENELPYWDNWYRIEVRVRDNLNWTDTKVFYFKRDNVPPAPATQIEPIAKVGRGEMVKLAGRAEENQRITLIVRDTKTGTELMKEIEKIPVKADGTYSYTIPALPHALTVRPDPLAGRVTILLHVVDEAGNVSPDIEAGTMLVDRYKPIITIKAPPKEFTTTDVVVTITGKVDDNYSGLAWMNATFDPGTGVFSVTVSLREGKNEFTISATDAAGNSETVTWVIHRTVPPWALVAVIVAIVAVLIAAIAVLRRR